MNKWRSVLVDRLMGRKGRLVLIVGPFVENKYSVAKFDPSIVVPEIVDSPKRIHYQMNFLSTQKEKFYIWALKQLTAEQMIHLLIKGYKKK